MNRWPDLRQSRLCHRTHPSESRLAVGGTVPERHALGRLGRGHPRWVLTTLVLLLLLGCETIDEAGTPNGAGQTVKAEKVKVPRLAGLRIVRAKAALRSAGLQVRIKHRPSDERAGTILVQRPAAGARIKEHKVVLLIVATPRPEPKHAASGGGGSGDDGGGSGGGGGCTPGYSPCLPPASDYDCAGGSGDGPAYTGYVTVSGSDPYGLDADGDGVGCE